MLYRFGKLVCKVCTLDRSNGQFLSSVLGAFGGQFAQHHLRVVYEILVDGKAILGFAQLHPVRLMVDGAVTLLQEDNVADNIRTSVGTESVVGQTNGPQQIGSFCYVLAGRRIFTVQRVTTGNKRHHAARTHLVDGFRKEIIVDTKSQLVVRLIVDLVLTERHIAHRQIVKITAVGGFKASHGNVCLRIQFFCNAPGDAVQFHAVQTAVPHGVRQHSKEVAYSHTRFQNITGLKAHLLDRIIDGTNHHRRGVVGVQSRSASGGVLVLGKQPFQLRILFCPVVLIRVKSIRQTAPAYILRKHLLLLGGGTTVFLFQLEQGADGFNVPGEFLFGASDAQIIIRDVEVSGRLRSRMLRFNCGRFCTYRLNYNVKRQIVFLGGVYGNRFFSTNWPGSIWFVLPQTVLELSFIDNLVIPRLSLRAGVDANIRFAHITDFPFDGSGRKINDNIVTDLVIGQGAFHHILFLLVQLPDKSQRFFPENRHTHFCQCYILQGHAAPIIVYRIHSEGSSLHVDGSAQRQQCRVLLRLFVVMLQFFVRNADQFGEIQCFQLCFGQIFQTFVLPLVYQHLAQIPFYPVSHQIYVDLNGDLFIGGVGVGNANLG